jgi:regulator of replication initiation timing
MLIILTFANKKNDFTHMSNNTETNSHDQEIATLKSTIDNLMQENKQLLESNEQLKIEDSELRDFITNVVAVGLETQIQLISGWSKLLLEYYTSPQQFSQRFHGGIGREDIIRMTLLTCNAALKLHLQIEHMKRDISRNAYRKKV